MDRKIERVLLLGDRTVLRRPIPAALVLEALPKACAQDKTLCEEVRSYLQRYMRGAGVVHLKVTGTATDGDSTATVPNEHGLAVDNPWEVRARAYYQFNDYLLFSAGAIARESETVATDSLVSFGFDKAQLDVGYRDHWLSPLADSSSLIGTQASTMPSVTLSNYVPFTRLGLTYELFVAEMSRQDNIAYFGGTTSGRPRLSGLQAGISPGGGYSAAINRVMQYGGGARGGGGTSDLIDALFTNSNRPDQVGQSTEFGNQVAALTSSIVFPGKHPFAVHIEYAGEDNAYSGKYRLGATNLSLGIDFPRLWNDFDFSYEVSEWQNSWYVHHIYPAGLTNRGHVIGHWFGDERLFGDAIGGRSQSLRAGWQSPSGAYWQATYRTSKHDAAWRVAAVPGVTYERAHALMLNVTTAWRGREVGAELQLGRDAFGESFGRLGASMDFAKTHIGPREAYETASRSATDTEVFVDLGAHYGTVLKLFGSDIPNVRTDPQANAHLGIGVRRRVSAHSDLGVRLEADRMDEHNLLSLRALDYRYRLGRRLALSGFFGVGRYDFGLPAYGYYFGAGVHYRDVLPQWDLSLDLRRYDKLGRDKTLPGDPPVTPDRSRLFFDMEGIAFYVSRRF